MKKIYMTLMAALVGVSVFAQSNLLSRPEGHRPLNAVIHGSNPTPASSQSFYVDYGYMDQKFTEDVNGYTYNRYIWDMNMNYNLLNGDTSLRWGVVDFNPLYVSDYTQTHPFAQIASNYYNTITVDTIFFVAGHSNYSGQNDTLLIRIVQCNTAGYPTATAAVLHTDTIITNTSMTGSATWLSNTTFYVVPAFTIASNTTKWAVKVEYYGSLLDTFGLTAGFDDFGTGNCPANTNLPNFAILSDYARNSYRHDMRFSVPPYNYQQLPTSTALINNDTYYECNGTSGQQAGVDSENFLQNWDLWVHVTVDGVGIDEVNGGLGVGQNVPNPTTGNTEIPYELKNNSKVTLTIFDVTGNQVMTQTENSSAGAHKFNVAASKLAAGVYYYTVATSEGSITHKMIVSE